jgi:23S rRNA pseudouridine1911/1915/1917 synthase
MTSSSPSFRTQLRVATVTRNEAGLRLDKFLALSFADLSRARIKSLIQEGGVKLKDQVPQTKTIEDPSHAVKPGEHYEVAIPPPAPAHPKGQDIALDVLFEDEHLIVIAKPAGLVVHPAPGNADLTLVNALIAHCGASLSGIGGVRRPGIVHRLDKDTSGVLVVAKTDQAHRHLAAQFAGHSMEREYLAVVWGLPRPSTGVVEGAIGRSTQNRKKMTITRDGKPARTHYRLMESWGPKRPARGANGNSIWASLLACRLETGRTHQIRVHLSQLGHPLIGDPLYGRGRRLLPQSAPETLRAALEAFHRQALHAHLLGFIHPASGKMMQFNTDPPGDFQHLVAQFQHASRPASPKGNG